ncbi:hypothetical protein K2173_028340 [Erythroxylum novogranatense]|uniref:Uncharacterized protein n=1 Tax=Erythroxylum novogranatense TaxID=1862640 RepID=A0AAV8U5K2_9ROSI|nr:hypothetical protein K2173_028340 [Erythroxylum novogranatense]
MGEPSSPLGPFPPLSSTVAAGSPPASRELEDGELRASPPAGRGAWHDLVEGRQWVATGRMFSSCWHDDLDPEVRTTKVQEPFEILEVAGVVNTGDVVREVPRETSSSPPSSPLDVAEEVPIEDRGPQLVVGSQPEVAVINMTSSSVGIEAGLEVEPRISHQRRDFRFSNAIIHKSKQKYLDLVKRNQFLD